MFAYCRNKPVTRLDSNGNLDINALYNKLNAEEQSIWNKCNIAQISGLAAARHAVNTYVDEFFESQTYATGETMSANYLDGTLANAFRHAMLSALYTKNTNSDLAYEFTSAHELNQINRNDAYLEGTLHSYGMMDLYYNALGIETAQSVDPNGGYWELAFAVLQSVLSDQRHVIEKNLGNLKKKWVHLQ